MTKILSKINEMERKKRIKKTAEVFTPNKLVNEMLNKMPDEVWGENKTFLDPSCGNGNFLIHILWKKLSKGHDLVEALKTIYGLDIMKGNIKECRLRLLKIISLFEEVTKEHIKIITINVRWLNTVKWPNGSLDYDMLFRNNINNRDIDKWFESIQNGELELVDLPITDNDISVIIEENGKKSKKHMESYDLF
jgi:hypothetical protein